MVNFANPQLLYLLLAVPVLAALYVYSRYLRRRRIARFGNPEVLSALMPDVSRYLPAVKICLALTAIAALVVVLARPRSQGKATEESKQGIEVMIAVDVSNSMLASSTDDPRGISRLQRAKHVLGRLIDNLEQDRVGLIVFAGEAYTQLPLTPDFMSAKLYLNDISTGMIENQGTSIGAAIEVAMNSFSGAADVERAIVVITDAEDQIGDAAAMAEVAHRDGIEVDVIGLGSGKGAQIPLDKTYSNWLKDEEGRVVTTYLDETIAQEIARAGSGIYINGASPSALNDLVKRLDEIKKSDLGTMTYTAANEQFPLFALIALILIVFDCIFSNRKIGFLRKYNFFSRGGAAVAALMFVPAVASAALPASAPLEDNSMRAERRFIREGNEQFRQNHYREAEILYRRALDVNPESEIAQYNEALTRLHLGADNAEANSELMANAVETLQRLVNDSDNPQVAELSAYNLGNVAFTRQDLRNALNFYKQALRLNPSSETARENFRYVQKMIQDQQNQQQDQQKEDQQNQQDQNQQQQDQQDQNKDQQQQQQNQQQQQDRQEEQKRQSASNSQQILDAVEKKDAAARARAARQQNGQGAPAGPSRGKNW